jgi:hypothetical protein
MNQYIITEEIVCSGCDMCNKDAASKNECSILFNVRSHPYQSERDKFLKRMLECISQYEMLPNGMDFVIEDLLAELRQAGEP